MNKFFNGHRIRQANIPVFRKPVIIWDLDGTVIDESLYRICTQQIFKNVYGIDLSDEDYALHFDKKSYCLESTAKFLNSKNVNHSSHIALKYIFEQIDDLFRELIKYGKVQAIELSIKLIHTFNDLGHIQALVTGASKETVDEALVSLVPNVFDVVIAREDTFWQKPYPHPYQLCFMSLGVEAQDCVIIENSCEGLMAAKTSGAKTINVGAMSDFR